MKKIIFLLAPLLLIGLTASAELTEQPQPHVMNITPDQMKWDRIFPEIGEKSAEITMLRVDPETKATQLMIRVPPNFHVPKHWHSANEVHVILSGTFIMECEGMRETLAAGSYNFIPKTMQHEAWTLPNEGALLFITVDGAWDINWVNGPPKSEDLSGGIKN